MLGSNGTHPGLLSSFFWEQGFDKVCESSRTLELFEQFDVQFRKWRILLVPYRLGFSPQPQKIF